MAGMSGSPVYIDDRLAGAVAYSWAFTSEALALITPIAAMRQLSALDPGEAAGGSLGLSAPGASAPFERSVQQILEPPEDVAEAVSEVVAKQLGALLAPADWGGRGASIATLGFGEPVRRMLAAAPAGRAEVSDAPELGAGSAVAGVLIDGDLKLAVGGTVDPGRGWRSAGHGPPLSRRGTPGSADGDCGSGRRRSPAQQLDPA